MNTTRAWITKSVKKIDLFIMDYFKDSNHIHTIGLNLQVLAGFPNKEGK